MTIDEALEMVAKARRHRSEGVTYSIHEDVLRAILTDLCRGEWEAVAKWVGREDEENSVYPDEIMEEAARRFPQPEPRRMTCG